VIFTAKGVELNSLILSLQDAAKVVQQFMARDPTEVHFTVVALAKVD